MGVAKIRGRETCDAVSAIEVVVRDDNAKHVMWVALQPASKKHGWAQ